MSISLSRLLAVTVLKTAWPEKRTPMLPHQPPPVSPEQARVRDEKVFGTSLKRESPEQVFRRPGPITIREANDSLYPSPEIAAESLMKAEEDRERVAREVQRTGIQPPWIVRQNLDLLKGSYPLNIYQSKALAESGVMAGYPSTLRNNATLFLGKSPEEYKDEEGPQWWREAKAHELGHTMDPYAGVSSGGPLQPLKARTSKLVGSINKAFHELPMPAGHVYDNRDAMAEIEPIAKELKLRLYHMGIDPYGKDANQAIRDLLIEGKMGEYLKSLKGDAKGAAETADFIEPIMRQVASTDRPAQKAATYA